jgi:hypothetical protein
MKELRGFVYISTAYVNAHQPSGSRIQEQLYPLLSQDGSPLQHAALAAQLAALKPKAAEKKVRTQISATRSCAYQQLQHRPATAMPLSGLVHVHTAPSLQGQVR